MLKDTGKHLGPPNAHELSYIRRRFGLSQEEGAKILKTSRGYLKKIELGEVPCHVRYAVLYQRAIGREWFDQIRHEYASNRAALKKQYGGGLEGAQQTDKHPESKP